MIIIADAHVSKARGNHTAFFEMLAAIEKTDYDLVFLGDIFDLWIALPRYEEDIHNRFIAWCRMQEHIRKIGYLEGNHEYFLANERARAFTWCSSSGWWQDDSGMLFIHGDQINRNDKQYLIFNKLMKNMVTKLILRLLPYGPAIASSIKQGLKNTNKKFRSRLPWDEIRRFADRKFAEGVHTIFVGHFHRESSLPAHGDGKLYILPDWLSTRKLSIYEKNSQQLSTLHWKELS